MSLIAMSKTFATINSRLRGSVRHCTRSATGGSPAGNGAPFVHEQYFPTRFGPRHRRRYSFKMIVNNNEQRLQYLYFMLSGIVASALLALVYISLWTTADEETRERLKVWQANVTFIKPTLEWNYNNSWKHIGNDSYANQIYSAYYDHRIDILDIKRIGTTLPLGSFRVFAILSNHFKSSIYCILRYDDFDMIEVWPQEARRLHEDHDKSFAVYSVMCPHYVDEKTNHVRLPNAIAIGYSSDWLSHMSPSFVQISYPKDLNNMLAKSRPVLSVCVGPLQQGYDNALRIVEFVEMYRILGAQHFYFYVLNATTESIQVLNYYNKHNLATILNWNVDPRHTNDEDLHYSGIMAQINDCAYRAMVVDNYRYIAVVDFDEILIPYKHNSLAAFLNKCDEGRTSAFLFRNVFFHKKDSNDTFSTPQHTINRFLYTQTKVRRTLEPLPAYMRSKYIANPRAIIEAGNHNLWRSAPGYTDSTVHPTVGLLHHYRDKCINCKEVLIVDYTARKYGSLIWDRVDDTCLNVFTLEKGICPTGRAA